VAAAGRFSAFFAGSAGFFAGWAPELDAAGFLSPAFAVSFLAAAGFLSLSDDSPATIIKKI
jgi:hypothetical protein